MTHTASALRRKAPLIVALGLGALALPALAQGPAGTAAPGRDGKRFERMADRMKERCERFEDRLADMDKKLTAEQVRDIIAGRLAETGNSNLKAGKATQKGEVVTVEIVTKDGSLVNTRDISTKTGLPAAAGQRCDKMEERLDKAKAMMDERREHAGRGPGPGMGGMRDGRGPGPGGMGGFGLGLLGNVGPDRDLNLTSAQVKTLAESRLILLGNPRLKVGAVKEKDKDTYTIDIVTADNSLVLRRDVDKHTGRPSKAD